MKNFYRLVIVPMVLVGIGSFSSAYGWWWNTDTQKTTQRTTLSDNEETTSKSTRIKVTQNPRYVYRRAGFLTSDKRLYQRCPSICTRHKEKWTGNWIGSRWGHRCECDPQKRRWFSLTGDSGSHDLTYRWAGFLRSSQELANKCPQVCAEHNEEYSGHWRSGLVMSECGCRAQG